MAKLESEMNPNPAKPWYREPWPWILMSGPLLAMIGCGVTIWLANGHADIPVADAARHGLVVEKVGPAPTEPAARRP